tara:strand:- start:1883 stop:2464 length:582 start_codon:yes stop_codon:yes gene_type:complete
MSLQKLSTSQAPYLGFFGATTSQLRQDETMSRFKVGDRIRITVNPSENCNSLLRVGDVGIIDEFYLNGAGEEVSASMNCDLGVIGCFHNLENIELAKPKWTIYNNTLPWSDLSDKQKGKMLLGRHIGLAFTIDGVPFSNTRFSGGSSVYKAQYIELVKPEPTMEELFHSDFYGIRSGSITVARLMITKGWVKK